MNSARDSLIKVERLKNILVSRAVGQSAEADNDEYVDLRRELVANSQVQASIPSFVVSCRTLSEFWNFIKIKFSHYQERRDYLKEQFEPLLNLLEFDSTGLETASSSGDLFKRQFPAGLPFGLSKPNLAFVPEQGSQKAVFEDGPDVGVIREKVYPDFTYELLQSGLSGRPFTPSVPALIRMCQTEREKSFFLSYASNYSMWSQKVPILIPQAWIQWHSKTKANLRSEASSYADDLYRVDFVAFWKQKRFAILVDDISHYAKQVSARWDADEEAYSKQDRKLRKEGWQVFRVSNWEIRKETFIPEILADLREYIGF